MSATIWAHVALAHPNEDGAAALTKEGWRREYVISNGVRFYLHKITDVEDKDYKKWIIVDRDYDLQFGKAYVHQKNCLKAFMRAAEAERMKREAPA